MSQIQIGSIIKAYDFPGTTNCYIIGEVTKIDGDYIVATKIKEVFGGSLDLIFDGGRVEAQMHSTVVDCTLNPPRVIRQGAVDSSSLREACPEISEELS